MIVHSDIWGPTKIPMFLRARYFFSFIVEYTRMAFQKFHGMVSTQYQRQFQVLQSDNGGEFVNNALTLFLHNSRIFYLTLCPYSRNKMAWQNGRIDNC